MAKQPSSAFENYPPLQPISPATLGHVETNTNGAPPPPGWYDDGSGRHRWWDGYAWGPLAPGAEQSPEQAGQMLSVLSWLGFFAFAVILPLIVYLTDGKKNRFTRWHSAAAFNLQLTFLLGWLLGIGAIFATILIAPFGTDGSSDVNAGTPWAVVPFVGIFVLYGLGLVISIWGAVRAGQGQWWRCPVAIPFFRAHRREEPAAV